MEGGQFLRKNRSCSVNLKGRWGEARVVLDCCLPEARSDVFRVHSQFGEGELASFVFGVLAISKLF